MRKQYRFLLVSLVPALLLGSVFAVVQAQNAGTPAVKQARWSDPATWPSRKVPVAGDKVTIEKGKDVVLDVSPPALNGLTIEGKLSFADNKDLELTTEWIMVHGELEIGTEKAPHTRKATITFTDNVKDEDMSGIGGTNDRSDRGMMLMGGTLNLHGNRTNSWTKLSKTAEAGSNSIEVLNATGWRAGDMIVLASTDFDPHQAERRTIAAIRGNTITLDKKLDYMHFGKITFDVDERGEVGMLSRNIVVQASPDADTDALWRPHHGDEREQDVCRGRRTQSHGSEHASGPVSDPLAFDRRCAGAVHQELGGSRHLQPLRDRAWHKLPER